MLKMKSACETCACSLDHRAEAYICSYECTYCANCSASTDYRCPNCDGELLRRPTRERSAVDVASSQIKAKVGKLFGGT